MSSRRQGAVVGTLALAAAVGGAVAIAVGAATDELKTFVGGLALVGIAVAFAYDARQKRLASRLLARDDELLATWAGQDEPEPGRVTKRMYSLAASERELVIYALSWYGKAHVQRVPYTDLQRFEVVDAGVLKLAIEAPGLSLLLTGSYSFDALLEVVSSRRSQA